MKKELLKQKRDWARANGICQNCFKRPVLPEKSRCGPCMENVLGDTNRRRKEREERGMCIACGTRPSVQPTKYCQACREASRFLADGTPHADYMRSWAKEKKAAGICTGCGSAPARPHRRLCDTCAETRSEAKKVRSQLRKAEGRCVECGVNPRSADSASYCGSCYATIRNRQKDRVARLVQQKKCITCAKNPSAGDAKHCETCILKAHASKYLKSRQRWPELKALLDSQEGRCVYTGRKLTIGLDAEIDHRVAKENGGSDDIENLQWVHEEANIAKWKWPEERFQAFIRDAYIYTVTGYPIEILDD